MPLRSTMLLVALCAGACCSTSTANLIDFEDLPASPAGTPMPAGYQGLQWGGGWHFMTSAAGNNFLALSVPSTLVATFGAAEFELAGAEFWSRRGADANGDFYFVLYRDGAVVYNGLEDPDGRQRFGAAPAFFAPNYAGPIDAFALAFDNDDHDHLAMDNLQIAFVPAPGVCAAALACGSLVLRRRREQHHTARA